MFLILDELRIANWQRSKDGAKNRNRPKRLSPLANDDKPVVKFGGTDLPTEEVRKWLNKIGPDGDDDDSVVAPATATESASLTVDLSTWQEVKPSRD